MQCALFEADTLVRHAEVRREPAKTSDSTLASFIEAAGPDARILASALPTGRLLRLSSARGAPFAALTTLLALPPGQEPVFTACNAQNGDPTERPGYFPRLLAAAPLDSLRAARAFFADAGLQIPRISDATYVQIGALMLARETINAPVLLWDLGVDQSHFITMDQRGVLAVESCPLGINGIHAIIHAALGLRFAAAASKLFHEGVYDFSDDGPAILRRLLPELRRCLMRLPVGPKHFHIAGLGRDQHWLTIAIAEAWCLQPLQIDWASYGRIHGLAFASRDLAASLPASFGGLFLLAKHRASAAPAWQARWSDEPKPAPPPLTPPPSEPPAPHHSMLSALTGVFAKPKAKPSRRTNKSSAAG